ncbi:NHLP bacteriocin export ABC transporter permease/ATPase subunit [Rhodoferax sp.]|uniref:NHLP bacteriocin export ABC transporter permease/ATPase subunit n=1 Tax=Rhodoferax sp. TaxID=50421 RepID=UPI002717CD36|nr:NHLP bacteriocin export ABC transporter permease/ATPase subunit [Rhodoferax sp.]MDO8320839.1 NHLP bacteriocin export ABC transporter permease/ATPase subunit [Rhodoferax sp.]
MPQSTSFPPTSDQIQVASAELAAYWPATLPTPSNLAPLRLDGEQGVFLILQGRVNIFCVDPEDNNGQGGRRHFLMQCAAGDIMLGIPAIAGRQVLAVGALQAQIAYAEDAEQHIAGLPAALSSDLLARWWQQLDQAGAIQSEAPQGAALAQRCAQAADAIAQRIEHDHQIRLKGLTDVWHSSTLALAHGLDGLARVLTPDDALPAASDSGVLEPPLVKVARRVAAAAGIDLRLPPALAQGNDLEALLAGLDSHSRKVLLRMDWWLHDSGPLIGVREDGSPVGLLPTRGGGYEMYDPASAACVPVNESVAQTLGKEASMLYARLPGRALKPIGLWQFAKQGISRDAALLLTMGVAAATLGLLVPVATGMLVESVIPRAAYAQHWQLMGALLAAAIGAAGFEVTKGYAMLRIEGRIDGRLQAALFDRLLTLPIGFFKKFTAGDLGDRTLGIQKIRETLSATVTTAVLAALFSVASLALMFWYSWQLSLIGLAIVLVVLAGSAWLGTLQLREEREITRHQGKVEGLVLQFIIGVTKLRAAAAEQRAFAVWADAYRQQKLRTARAQRMANVQELVQACVPLLASALLFAGMVWLLKQSAIDLKLEALTSAASQIARPSDAPSTLLSAGELLAFNAAFGQFLAALIGMTLALTQAIGVVPKLERLQPLLDAEPENGQHRQPPGHLRGAIEFADVSFRYWEDGPPLLDRLSLTIEPGQFVAIVGPSGSGKSTLMRLMMGFELPQRGEVFFDGKPLAGLDLTALRRNIGVVLQSGRVFAGSLFANIAASVRITQQEAMDAARLVGLDADIEAMPMGMHTVLQEGGATLSGGQRQRLLLARALVHKPAILLLDEATSALDNKTQAIVMDSLRRLDITRVVIAHRLSTITHADRIVVVKSGKIIETGCYADLIAANGTFAELARRQLL